MGVKSWADVADESPDPPIPTRPIQSTSLCAPSRKDDRDFTQCKTCGNSFYICGEKHRFCPPCYNAWVVKRFGPKVRRPRRTTTSPASSRTTSTESGDAPDDSGMLRDLEMVLATPDLSEVPKRVLTRPPPAESTPPPPAAPPPVHKTVPDPTDVTELLRTLSQQQATPSLPPPPPPPPPRPTTASVGTQTGVCRCPATAPRRRCILSALQSTRPQLAADTVECMRLPCHKLPPLHATPENAPPSRPRQSGTKSTVFQGS